MFLRLVLVMVLSFSSLFSNVKQYGVEQNGYKFSDYSESEQKNIMMGLVIETYLDISIISGKVISFEGGSEFSEFVGFFGVPKKLFDYNIKDKKISNNEYKNVVLAKDDFVNRLKINNNIEAQTDFDILILTEVRKLIINNNNCVLSRGSNCADNNTLINILKGGG